MPNISKDNQEISTGTIEQALEAFPAAIIPYPVMLCGVNRKTNIGNYENVDVYGAIGIPIMALPGADLEAFKEAAREAAEIGFSIASRETGSRYEKIKDLQEGK